MSRINWKWTKIVLPCLLKSWHWFPVLPWALKNLLTFKECCRWGTHPPPGLKKKSKTAGFTHSQFLCYILVLWWSYCDVWLHEPLMSTNITFQRLSRGLGTRFGTWELSYGTLFWPTSSPSLTMFNITIFWSIIYNLQSTALAFFNLQIHPLTDWYKSMRIHNFWLEEQHVWHFQPLIWKGESF